jgi:hypothetical protein
MKRKSNLKRNQSHFIFVLKQELGQRRTRSRMDGSQRQAKSLGVGPGTAYVATLTACY